MVMQIRRALFVALALFASLSWAGKAPPNPPPTVAIASPASGASFAAPANVVFTATASDTNGTVTQVAYYSGKTLIGTATTAPYTVTWANVGAGSYSVTAKATDNGGATTTSTAVAITVTAAGGGGGNGNIAITSPANGATVYGSSVAVSGTFVSSTTPTYVWVDNGASSRLATISGTTYSATLPLNIGANTVTASVVRADKTSDKTSISVNGNTAPLVVFTSPSRAPTSAPANLTLGVDAVSPGGSIAKVSFFKNGTTLLGTATSAPYQYNWANVAAGSYSITATATDNNGQTGSDSVTLQVGPPNLLPFVSISSPTATQTFTAPANIPITVDASDPDGGSIAQVEFLQNGNLLGVSNVAPYKLTWQSAPQGTYALTARATDNMGGVATSPVVNVTVNPAPPVSMDSSLNGATFTAPAAVTLSATTGGPALGVEFYKVINGSNVLIGGSPSTSSPYTYQWNVQTAGTYTVMARTLVMVQGFPTPFEFWSSPVTFTVTAPPPNPAGDITYLHHDFAGSVIAATDGNGTVLWKEDYKPYGERVVNDAASQGNRQFFTGKPLDKETGLSYMGARYYDPAVGRFMGVDSVGFKPESVYSFNRFAYANNNPYRFVDPDGRFPMILLAPVAYMGVGALIGGGINTIHQYVTTGTVQWGGIGGVLDAAGDGATFGLLGIRAGASKPATTVTISRSRHPEAAAHAEQAIEAGQPSTLTIDRTGAAARRKQAMKGTKPVPGKDRDEYPPAMFQEGGEGASVRAISRTDNRGAGSCMGAQCRNLPEGAKVNIKVAD